MEDTRSAVLKETKYIVIGCVTGTLVMLGVFALLNQFNTQVLFGGIYGCTLAILNFYFLGVTVRKLAETALGKRKDDSEEIDPEIVKMAKLKVQRSYMTRMVVGIGLLILAIAVLKLNWIACLVPLIFPRITILVRQFGQKAGNIKGSDIK